MLLFIGLLCACITGCGSGVDHTGIGGSWCPGYTEEEKAEYMKAAEEEFYKAYGIMGSTEGIKVPIYFTCRGKVYATKEETEAHRDEWTYVVFLKTEDGSTYRVHLDYDTKEAFDITKDRKPGGETEEE